ncbi:hypothetical protein [Corynebacterium sp. A21]|uniref:hypothetical protein n=1 Tax=Corynebacterium sp. A21 TaxID=3457318 RepID=UPI003FD1E27F
MYIESDPTMLGKTLLIIGRKELHPAELRERATRMAVDARQDPETFCGAMKRVADQ